MRLAAFHVSSIECAVPLARVREILEPPPVTPVPGASAALRGLANLRGRVIPVLDLALRLGATPSPTGRPALLVVDAASAEGPCALWVDGIRGLEDVPDERVLPPRREVLGAGDWLAGFVETERGIVLVLDVERLLDPAALRRILPAGPPAASVRAVASATASSADPVPEGGARPAAPAPSAPHASPGLAATPSAPLEARARPSKAAARADPTEPRRAAPPSAARGEAAPEPRPRPPRQAAAAAPPPEPDLRAPAPRPSPRVRRFPLAAAVFAAALAVALALAAAVGREAIRPARPPDGRRAPPVREGPAKEAAREPIAISPGAPPAAPPATCAPAPALRADDRRAHGAPLRPGDVYEVVEGDTLWNISRRMLGDPHAWGDVHAANRPAVPDPDLIRPGQRLVIPAREPHAR